MEDFAGVRASAASIRAFGFSSMVSSNPVTAALMREKSPPLAGDLDNRGAASLSDFTLGSRGFGFDGTAALLMVKGPPLTGDLAIKAVVSSADLVVGWVRSGLDGERTRFEVGILLVTLADLTLLARARDDWVGVERCAKLE